MNIRAWVVGAYGNSGGNNMNYNIACICHDVLGLETKSIVLNNSMYNEKNVFNHRYIFEEVNIQEFIKSHSKDDILISNPSFSNHMLGFHAKCKKIMYVQGFSTYSILDTNFDHYVAVSSFVRKFLSNIYNIKASIISAFILNNSISTPFIEKEDSLLICPKLTNTYFKYFYEYIKSNIQPMEIEILDTPIEQNNLLSNLDKHKYYLSLSTHEGFGLVPLEAMSKGAIVFGFDGFGGQDFFIHGYNCMVNKLTDWSIVPDSINHTIHNSKLCRKLSLNARATAENYSKDKFVQSWTYLLKSFLN